MVNKTTNAKACYCCHCSALGGLLILIIGVLFLLKDLFIFEFWGVNWWTIGFLLTGLFMLFHRHASK